MLEGKSITETDNGVRRHFNYYGVGRDVVHRRSKIIPQKVLLTRSIERSVMSNLYINHRNTSG
jgi:hypothetical protein